MYVLQPHFWNNHSHTFSMPPLARESRKRASYDYENNTGSKRSKTQSVVKNKSVIRRSIRPIQELKRTTQGTTIDISGADYGYVLSYPFPDVGDLVNQRDGSQIMVKGNMLRLQITPPAGFPTFQLRVIVVQYKQNFGGAPTANVILGNLGAASYNINAPFNMRTTPMFHVLHDKVMDFNSTGVDASGAPGVYAPMQKTLILEGNKTYKASFSSGGAGVPPSDNHMYALFLPSVQNTYNIKGVLSTTFVDI